MRGADQRTRREIQRVRSEVEILKDGISRMEKQFTRISSPRVVHTAHKGANTAKQLLSAAKDRALFSISGKGEHIKMASVRLELNGEVRISPYSGNGCLSADFTKRDGVIYRDTLYLHGTTEELRSFALKLLGALPVEKAEITRANAEDGEAPYVPPQPVVGVIEAMEEA